MKFFTPDTRMEEPLAVLMLAMLSWCPCDIVGLSWCLQVGCCFSTFKVRGNEKGWYKLSPAKQKLSQEIADILLLTPHRPEQLQGRLGKNYISLSKHTS